MAYLKYWPWAVGALAALALYLCYKAWPRLLSVALSSAHKAGDMIGYQRRATEQEELQREAMQRADEAREAASAVTELTDQEAIDLATTKPKRKK